MGVAYHNLLLTKKLARSSIFCNILHFFIPHFSFQQTIHFLPPFLLDCSHFSNNYQAFYKHICFQDSHMNFQTIIQWFASPHIIGSIHHCHYHTIEYVHIFKSLHSIKPLIKGITKMLKSFRLMPKQVWFLHHRALPYT